MTDICDGCEGDKFCQIQDDMGHPDYSCPINSKWAEAMDKLEAVNTHLTKWVSGHSDWQMGRMSQWKEELVQILGESE